jgi:hypothetical protein
LQSAVVVVASIVCIHQGTYKRCSEIKNEQHLAHALQTRRGFLFAKRFSLRSPVERPKEVFDEDCGGCGMTMAFAQILDKAGITLPHMPAEILKLVAGKNPEPEKLP